MLAILSRIVLASRVSTLHQSQQCALLALYPYLPYRLDLKHEFRSIVSTRQSAASLSTLIAASVRGSQMSLHLQGKAPA